MKENKLINLTNAVKRLNEARVAYSNEPTNDYIRDSIIQRFEFSIELAWKTLREIMLDMYYLDRDINSPRSVIAKAYQEGFIDNESIWLQMLGERNNMAHVYNADIAIEIAKNISLVYAKELSNLVKKLKSTN